MSDLASFITPTLTVCGSFVAAWIGARLSLGNFYKQQRWGRKADAYTSVFEALHGVARWYEKHIDGLRFDREIGEDQVTRLREEANRAEETLERCLAGQAWNLPDEFRTRAERLTTELSSYQKPNMTWSEYLGTGQELIEQALRELDQIARRDLQIR